MLGVRYVQTAIKNIRLWIMTIYLMTIVKIPGILFSYIVFTSDSQNHWWNCQNQWDPNAQSYFCLVFSIGLIITFLIIFYFDKYVMSPFAIRIIYFLKWLKYLKCTY